MMSNRLKILMPVKRKDVPGFLLGRKPERIIIFSTKLVEISIHRQRKGSWLNKKEAQTLHRLFYWRFWNFFSAQLHIKKVCRFRFFWITGLNFGEGQKSEKLTIFHYNIVSDFYISKFPSWIHPYMAAKNTTELCLKVLKIVLGINLSTDFGQKVPYLVLGCLPTYQNVGKSTKFSTF